MPELIIGHTTHNSTRVWLCGGRRHRWARVTLKPPATNATIRSAEFLLTAASDYTAVAEFVDLEPDTPYRVLAEFAACRRTLRRSAGNGRAGRLHTYPGPEAAPAGFSFLVGSCNLSTARLETIGALVVSSLGNLAMNESVTRAASTWLPLAEETAPSSIRRKLFRGWLRVVKAFPFLLRRASIALLNLTWGTILQLTRFQQPRPMLRSPFESILSALRGDADGDPPSFMIHAGDQMYFDIDVPPRRPDVDEYRRSYRQTWFEDPMARAVLAACPHYMILDDHEIVDGFANQPYFAKQLEGGRRAYAEYVHSRHPQEAGADHFHYQFDYGKARYFVLDTRTERNLVRREMIGKDQLGAFEDWLVKYRDDLKFVVSSVPFVAQLRAGAKAVDSEAGDERDDKWCGALYSAQREHIIDYAHQNQIGRLVFLVGDMHCTYHATMRVGGARDRVSIHEFAAGPINQVQFTERRLFDDHFRGFTGTGIPFTCTMRSFHGASAAVLRLTVEPERDHGIESVPLRLRYGLIPTSPAPPEGGYQPPPLSGHVTFRR